MRRTPADHDWVGEPTSLDVVTGWRLWRVVEHGEGVRLAAWSSPTLLWPAGRRAEAACLLDVPESHAPPQPGCRCGLYAFATRADAEAALAAEMLPGPSAIGRVSLWGRTIRHAGGWRSEFAYPYDLFVVGGTRELVRELRATYRVDADGESVAELLRRVRGERRRRLAERLAGAAQRVAPAGPTLGAGPA